MPKTTIVELVNSAKETEEEMPTPHKNRWSQPLSNNEDSDEELVNDEQNKERKNNHNDAFPSHGVKHTWGFHKVKLRKLWLSSMLPASNSRKG